MWSYIPHTREDKEKMCKALGIASIDELFDDIPKKVRMKGDYDIPGPMTEDEINRAHARAGGQKFTSG